VIISSFLLVSFWLTSSISAEILKREFDGWRFLITTLNALSDFNWYTLRHCFSEDELFFCSYQRLRCENVDSQLKLPGPVVSIKALNNSKKSFTPFTKIGGGKSNLFDVCMLACMEFVCQRQFYCYHLNC